MDINNMFYLFFLTACLVAKGTCSFNVVNNVTVPSDVLKDIFYKEIAKRRDVVDVVAYSSKQYDSKKCLQSLREILNRFPSSEVAPFFDAWGKFPAGILIKNNYDIGNFDECVQTSVNLNEQIGIVEGQFCFAKIPLTKEKSRMSFDKTVRDLNIGICVPSTCSPEFLKSTFEKSAENIFNGALLGTTVAHCTNGKTPPFTTMNIVAISVFSIFTGLMILSSLYDFFVSYYEKTPIPVLLAFSILTNGKKLFAINTKKSPNNIDCLTGIRVLSTIWIINHHEYSNALLIPLINKDAFFNRLSLMSMLTTNGTLVVDSFFFIGGLLIAWIGFRDLDRSNGRVNYLMNDVHRYIRLTPVVAAGLLMLFGIYDIIFTGPFRDVALEANTCNGHNWWPILVYIQNYYVQDAKCYDEAWYLAVDFQLYVLSPLLLIPMWKWGKKFVPVVIALIIGSIAYAMTVFITNGFTGLTIGGNDSEWEKTYTPAHTRCVPWLVGFIFGYYMHINRQKVFKIPPIVQLLGWIASFTTLFAIVFAPYVTLSQYGQATVFEAAMYEGFKRLAWGLSLAWITFACQCGFGGVVDAFLSHPFWQPFGRLTYSLYLMHMAVIRMHMGMMRTHGYYGAYSKFLDFWHAFGIASLLAIYMSLAFEAPILVLEKFVFGDRRKADKKPPELTQKEV